MVRDDDFGDAVLQRVVFAEFLEALARLAPQQGQLLLLRQLGLSYAELAEVCEINPNSIGKTLSRAADAFRKAFEAVEQLALDLPLQKRNAANE